MAKAAIGLGAVANDGNGDDLRAAGGKINDNFDELYTALGNGTALDVAAAVAATAAVTANTAKVTNATHTGDVTGSGALTIADDAVTNAKAANVATATIKGRITAGTGDPEDLTATQVRTLINVEDGATADQSNGEIETAYNTQVAAASQAEMEAGTETAIRRVSPLRVAQAIAALAPAGTVTTGSGAPATTPGAEGNVYIDTTADVAYIAVGTASSADWLEILTSGSGSVLTSSTTVVAADSVPVFDASASGDPIQRTWTNLFADLGIATKTGSTAATESLLIAVSDETTALTTGTGKITFRMPYAFTLTAVRSSVTTAPVGSTLVVDINEAGVTILSTKLSIDASEKTSTTAATAAVISDTALADDAEITIDIDQVGSSTAGAGLKVTLIGYKT